jgi:hypothetical protein
MALVAANLGLKVAAIALAAWPILDPAASHFQGKAMGVRAAIYPWAAVAIPAWWWLAGRPRPYPYLADIALVTPFVIDAAGNVFGLFAVRGFDAFPHFVGWLCLVSAFGLASYPIVRSPWLVLALGIGAGATADIVWEIGEFLLQRSGSSGLQLTYENTIQDLAVSLLGSIVGAALVATLARPTDETPRRAFGWTRD